jgi:hypothetical protein
LKLNHRDRVSTTAPLPPSGRRRPSSVRSPPPEPSDLNAMQQVEQAADGFKRIAIKYDPIGGFYALLDSCMPPVANLAARIRVTVLEAVMEHGPQSVVQSLLSPSLTHVLSALACLYLLSAVLATTRALNLFAFHPIFMSVGVLAFMTEGFLVYRNGALVSTFADIMAGSAKSQARSIHMVLQVSGSVFIFMGLVFICSNKMRLGKSLVPATLHAWVGTVATLLVLVQGIVGQSKVASSAPVHKWHGSAGKLAYDCCLLAVVTGAVSFLPTNIYNVGAELTVLVLWLSSELQHTMAERKARHGNGHGGHSGAGGTGIGSADGGGGSGGGSHGSHGGSGDGGGNDGIDGSSERDAMLGGDMA